MLILQLQLQAQAQAPETIEDYFRFGIASQDSKELGLTQGIWAGVSWADQPWGAWNLQAGHHRSEHLSQINTEVSWEYRKKLGSRLRLSINLGLLGALQEFTDEDFSLEQKSIRGLLGTRLETMIKDRVSIGLRVIFLSQTLHNFQELDMNQGRISQIVTKLDQSLLISAQLGLSYLFK